MILRPLPALAALLTLVGPAAAQAPKPPAPATLEQIERLEAGPRRRDFYLSPQAAESARAAEAKMEAMQRKMDARVRRATRSICDGCAGQAARRRDASAAPRDDVPGLADPAQAPLD
ncbi:hypothetical protein GCM10007886_09770 [Methylobacterium gregans]|uniref:Secreted protein n=1 Tax=Methylobacterium gregans TaxID=374424 RepID=A0AA37MB21_9HYPH|nr:hypothetical protein [Methylobacterium gregans]MDQ0519564.1 hypothetical protein [Methylobacterium gregans]GJD79337.1 hypothetical protein NBEOAGPD_2562 [Methylobacterium gregans]GLS52794.1 hypothetical protein GCM10007886_09770 [Methylobacterium gregans]